MPERFVENTGTISVANGASTVVGTGTVFSGKDRAGAQLWVQPAAAAPYRVGTVAEVDPRGVYENLSLPLVSAWGGTAIVDQPFELIDSIALSTSASLVAVVARWVAQLEQNAGLVFNTDDDLVYDRIQNNSLVVDDVTRIIYQWRGGVLVPLRIVGVTFNPAGPWSALTEYETNDMVEHGGFLFISNDDANLNHEPDEDGTPTSDAYWTWFQAPTAASVAAEALVLLGLNSLTISESAPVGTGTTGDLHIQVSP